MRNFLAISASVIAFFVLISSITMLYLDLKEEVGTFPEPSRTEFMLMCIDQVGFSVTSCLCQEYEIIKNKNQNTLDEAHINGIIKDCGSPINSPTEADPFTRG